MTEEARDKEKMAQWVVDLETRLKTHKQKLGHEFGSGAKCFRCKEQCPGLDLHFWRKKCKNCHCPQEEHDVVEDDNIRFQILFNSPKYKAVKSVLEVKVINKQRNAVLKQFSPFKETECIKPMKFDWVPPEVSPDMAAEYMNELPRDKIPICGSEGSKYRKIQLKKQIPMHDIKPERELFTKHEEDGFEKFLGNLRENAGIGKILRLKQIQYCEHSQPYNMQSALSSGSVKPKTDEDEELINATRNINIQPFAPRGFQPNIPLASYDDPSNTTLQNLPGIENPTTLRVPSYFISQNCAGGNERMGTNNNAQPLNDNAASLSEDISVLSEIEEMEEPLNISGILPLSESPTEAADQPVGRIGLSNVRETPSKYAAIDSYHGKGTQSNALNEGMQKGNEDNVLSSDLENANSQVEATGVPPPTNPTVHLADENMNCVQCLKTIPFNSIAVFVDKGGHKAAWHPSCFVCKDCEELLVDLMYFFHKGFVYCARHYTEKLDLQRCFACDEIIFVKLFTFAEGNYYHLHHFCCVECDVELAGLQYVLNEFNKDLPTCLNCFEVKYSKKCLTCGGAIKVNQQAIKFKVFSWHSSPDCFRCNAEDCHKSLISKKFLMKNTAPFCSNECANKVKS